MVATMDKGDLGALRRIWGARVTARPRHHLLDRHPPLPRHLALLQFDSLTQAREIDRIWQQAYDVPQWRCGEQR